MTTKFHLITGPDPFPLGLVWDGAKSMFDTVMVTFQSDTAGSNTMFSGTLITYIRYTDPSTGKLNIVPCTAKANIDDTETTGLAMSFIVKLPGPVQLGSNKHLALWIQKPPGCNTSSSAVRTPTAWKDYYFLRGNYLA